MCPQDATARSSFSKQQSPGPNSGHLPADAPEALWPKVHAELSGLPHLLGGLGSRSSCDGTADALTREVRGDLEPMARDLGREVHCAGGDGFPLAGVEAKALRTALRCILEAAIGSGTGPIRIVVAPEPASCQTLGTIDVVAKQIELPESSRKRAWEAVSAQRGSISLLAGEGEARVRLSIPLPRAAS